MLQVFCNKVRSEGHKKILGPTFNSDLFIYQRCSPIKLFLGIAVQVIFAKFQIQVIPKSLLVTQKGQMEVVQLSKMSCM